MTGRFMLPQSAAVDDICLAPAASALDAPFIRGDADQNGEIGIGDPIRSLHYMFWGIRRIWAAMTPPTPTGASHLAVLRPVQVESGGAA